MSRGHGENVGKEIQGDIKNKIYIYIYNILEALQKKRGDCDGC